MDKLFKMLLLPQDKANHAFYGLTLYSVLVFILPSIYSFFIVFTIAIGKELYDYRNKDKHTPDIYDALYTFIVPFILVILAYSL